MASGKGISDTHLFGKGVETGKDTPERVISLTEFENSIKLASSGSIVIPTQTVSAFVDTFTPIPGKATVEGNVLKAKSWAAPPRVFDPALAASLGAFIKAYSRGTENITAEVTVVLQLSKRNLPATLQPHRVRELLATLQPHSIQDVAGILQPIESVNLLTYLSPVVPFDIPATTYAVPGINLSATSGAHPPGNITAQLASVLPVDLPVYIRSALSGTQDMAATLDQTGEVRDLGVHIRLAQPRSTNIEARIGVIGRSIGDLAAKLQPYHYADILASITTQRISNVRAIISGVGSTHSDLLASIAKIDSATFNLSAYTIAQFIDLSDMSGKLRVVQLGGTDVPSSMTAVFPFYNINKVLIEYVPLLNLKGDIIQVGGLSGVRATITPKHTVHTGENETTGFVTTANSYRFYLGTTLGVLIPTEVIKETRIETFTNTYDIPDLHATISGWITDDLSASLKVYSFYDLLSNINAIGLDHIGNLSATIATFNTNDVSATVTPAGAAYDVSASAVAAGLINDLNALIVARIDTLALSVIPISTQPIFDLNAIINYDAFVRCSPTSMVSEISAYIRPLIAGTPSNTVNLTASILSTSGIGDMPASITSRHITKLNILSLTFTLKERSSRQLLASVLPTRQLDVNLLASIVGLSHEEDLLATLEVIRFSPPDVSFTLQEQVVNLDSDEVKDILISFKSQVQHYVYESVTESVYSTDRGTWAIDLRTLLTDTSLFDKSPLNREIGISDLSEYASLDAAVRAGIVILCERRQFGLPATLQAAGKVDDMSASCFAYSLDNVRDLRSKLMPVVSIPDISAQINTSNQSSSVSALLAMVTPNYFEVLSNMTAGIFGDIIADMSASITPI